MGRILVGSGAELSGKSGTNAGRASLAAAGSASLPVRAKPPPIVDLLGAAPMPLRELRHHRVRREALNNNAGLLFVRPAAASLAAHAKLDAPRRNRRWAVSSVVSHGALPASWQGSYKVRN